MSKKYRLSSLEMDEVSFVDKGDDPEARICLFKRAGEPSEGYENDGELDGDVVDAFKEDDSLFVTTDVGKVYHVDEFSMMDEGEEDETMVVEKATLIYDPDDDYEEPEMGLVGKMFERVSGALNFMNFGGVPVIADVDKGKFAQAMQASIADQAYSEMSQMCSALKGAVDSDLFSGSDPAAMVESVDEFAEAMKNAITHKWTKGQLIGKAADEELVAHAARRDRELLSINTDEGGATGEVNPGLRKSAESSEQGGEKMAGIDRSNMTPGQIAYLDTLEAGGTTDEALQAQANAEQGAGAVQAEAGQGEPGAADPSVEGTNPEDVVGDDGTHEAPFEKMLQGVPAPVAKILRSQQQQIAKMTAREEEQTYINKARGLSHLPVNPAEMGPVLKRIAKGHSTEADESYVLGVLRSAEEMAKQGGALMTNIGIGKGAGARVGGGSAEREVMEKAEKIASEKQIPVEVAFAEVRKDPANADLVERYKEEVQG